MRSLLPVCLAVTMFGVSIGLPAAISGAEPRNEPNPAPVSLILFLNADTFLCLPCLDRILGFARDIPVRPGKATLWAVVLYGKPPMTVDGESHRNVIVRRAESVFQANGLSCPIVIDEAGRWDGFSSDGAGLLILDSRTRSIHTFSLPLAPDALSTVKKILKEGGYYD